MEDNHCFINARVVMPGRAAIEGKFQVDTGGGFIMAVLNAPFVESQQLLASTRKTISDRSLSGLGGEVKLLVARATALELGHLVVRAPIINLSQDKNGALASADYDGVIGGELLRKFRVVFDYPGRRLILEPNARMASACEYNMSGISLRALGQDFKTFKVHQLIKDSPATEAGVREGDRFLAIDGKPAAAFTLDQIYQMFKQEGRELLLSLARGNERLEVKIKLRRLI